MKSKWKYTVTALAVVLAVGLSVFVYNYWFKEYDPNQDDLFNSKQTAAFETKLYKSDFDDIYYSLEPACFYQKEGGKFNEYPFVTTTITMEMFARAMTFDFHYINVNGQYFGFGEYENGETYYYIKGMNPPVSSSYNKPNTMALIFDEHKGLADYDRLYSECYIFDVNKNYVVTQYVQDRNRPVTIDGKKRNDFVMFTTEILQRATVGRNLFLTRAYYEYSEKADRQVDINAIKYGYTHDSYIYDILFNIAYDTPNGTFYYGRNANGGFDAKVGSGKPEDAVICHFDGEPYTDYLRSGDYIVKVKDLTSDTPTVEVTNPSTQETVSATLEKKVDKLDVVRVSDDGKKLAVFGTWDYIDRREKKTMQIVTLVDFAAGKSIQYVGNNLYEEHTPIFFDDDKVYYFTDEKLYSVSMIKE